MGAGFGGLRPLELPKAQKLAPLILEVRRLQVHCKYVAEYREHTH